jgi:UDP-glucose 4,6-dehydratase
MFQGNICSSDLVNYVLEEEEIDTIMHFAAQTHVGTSPTPCRSNLRYPMHIVLHTVLPLNCNADVEVMQPLMWRRQLVR